MKDIEYTWEYVSPDVYREKVIEKKKEADINLMKNDVYSLGITILEMFR